LYPVLDNKLTRLVVQVKDYKDFQNFLKFTMIGHAAHSKCSATWTFRRTWR